MKAEIDRDGCIACGLCAETCPEVFDMASDGYAQVIVDSVPEDEKDSAVECQENCPVSVITVTD